MLDVSLKRKFIPALAGFNPRSYGEAYWDRLKDPYTYLNQIGIEVICEFLINGFSPKDIFTKELLLPQRHVLDWIAADDTRKAQYDAAFEYAADSEMYDARDILDNAPLMSEAISKAGKQAEHRRHMAKGLGPTRWGNKIDLKNSVQATVSFNFDVALLPAQKAAIEGQATRVSQESVVNQLDLNELIGPGVDVVPLGLGVSNKEVLTYEEAAAQEESKD